MRSRPTLARLLVPLALGVALASAATPTRAQEAEEQHPERPPRPDVLPPLVVKPPPPTRHIDVGGGVALVHRVASSQTSQGPSNIAYPTALGFGLWARWSAARYVRLNLYALRASSNVDLPQSSLGLSGNPGEVNVTTYSFGLRVAPTLPLANDRGRAWLSAGIGWGRLQLGRFDVATSSTTHFQVRDRSASFVELPIGLGVSFDLIPNWLSVELESTASLHVAERGDALRSAQAIDSAGKRVPIGPFPELGATFVNMLGHSLLL